MQFEVYPSGLAAMVETYISRCAAMTRTLTLLLLGFACVAGIGWSQNKNTGEIRGTVVDESGAVIPGAKVVTTNMDTGLHVDRVTDGTGTYIAPFLQTGRYSVTVTKEGFKKFVQSDINLHIETVMVDAALQVGNVTAEVEVSTQQPLLQTETSEVNSVLSTTEIEALPNVGADWGSYTALVPGAYPAIWGGGAIPVVGKGWAAQNTGFGGGSESVYLIDGGGATFPISYNIDYLKEPLGAISEMNTTTSSAGAELSNGEASINLITKSGTNQYHGQASYLVQNDAFNAMNRYWGSGAPPAKQRLNWQQYDVAIGGPIVHNKLFFFFDFQHQKTAGTRTYWETFPDDAIRSGDFSGLVDTWAKLGHNLQLFDPTITGPDPANPGNPNFATRSTCGSLVCNNKVRSLDPVAVAIQKYFPEPNAQQNPLDPYTNNYYFQVGDPTIQKWFTYKGTGNITKNNQVNISGLTTIFSDAQNSYIPALNDNPESINEMSQQVSDVWTISPMKLNEFRASLVREGGYWNSPALDKGIATQIGLPQLVVDTFPSISFASGSTGNFSGQGSPFIAKLVQDGIQVADGFNWILRKHTLKFGVEYNNWTDNSGWGTDTPGGFNFDGSSTRDPRESPSSCSDPTQPLTCSSNGVSYADFLLGRVQNFSNTLIKETGGRNYTFQFYGQDYYKINSKLTVNFGLRFLHQPGWTEEHNRFSNFDPTVVNSADGTLGGLSFPGLNGAPRSLLETKHFVAPRGGFSWAPKANWAVHGGMGIYMEPWAANTYYNSGIGQGFDPYSTPAQPDIYRMNPMLQLQDGPLPMIYPTTADLTSGMKNYSDQGWIPRDTPIAYALQWNLGLQRQLGNYVVELTYLGNKGVNQSFQINGNSVQPNQLGDMSKIPYPNYNALWKDQWIGWSNYNALQLQARRQFAAGYSFEATWTWSHMLDTGTGLGAGAPGTSDWQQAFCVACNYGNAANDFRHNLQAHGVYQLPWGKGRKLANQSWLADSTIGGWQASGIFNLRSGFPETPSSYVNPLGQGNGGSWSGGPWPMRVPGQSVRLSHRTVKEWFNTKAFSVTPPYTFGNGGRDVVVGPRFWDFDFSLAKSWAIPRLGDKTNFQFKWDTYDILNHPNYNPPDTSIGDTNFGVITSDQGTQRNMMFSGIIRF